jgi:hypothetical protein
MPEYFIIKSDAVDSWVENNYNCACADVSGKIVQCNAGPSADGYRTKGRENLLASNEEPRSARAKRGVLYDLLSRKDHSHDSGGYSDLLYFPGAIEERDGKKYGNDCDCSPWKVHTLTPFEAVLLLFASLSAIQGVLTLLTAIGRRRRRRRSLLGGKGVQDLKLFFQNVAHFTPAEYQITKQCPLSFIAKIYAIYISFNLLV